MIALGNSQMHARVESAFDLDSAHGNHLFPATTPQRPSHSRPHLLSARTRPQHSTQPRRGNANARFGFAPHTFPLCLSLTLICRCWQATPVFWHDCLICDCWNYRIWTWMCRTWLCRRLWRLWPWLGSISRKQPTLRVALEGPPPLWPSTLSIRPLLKNWNWFAIHKPWKFALSFPFPFVSWFVLTCCCVVYQIDTCSSLVFPQSKSWQLKTLELNEAKVEPTLLSTLNSTRLAKITLMGMHELASSEVVSDVRSQLFTTHHILWSNFTLLHLCLLFSF